MEKKKLTFKLLHIGSFSWRRLDFTSVSSVDTCIRRAFLKFIKLINKYLSLFVYLLKFTRLRRSNSANNCTLCNISSPFPYLLYNICLSSCGNNYFPDKNKICQSCARTCSNCNVSSTNCTSCAAGFYLLNNKCISSCGVGYYANEANCLPCSSNCLECNVSAANCPSCIQNGSNVFLRNNSCIDSCPASYYISNSNLCLPCASQCLTCNKNPSNCIHIMWYNPLI